MMRIAFFIFLLIVGQAVSSQTGLIIQGASPGLHLVHTVVAKENWYSIGRIYNISPKELAPYNKTTIEKPLSIGQLLKVPLVATNFAQNGKKEADEIFIPLYHIVQEKEGMYRVSVSHNKVPAADLKKWNSLGSDQLKNGMKLVVGYLKVKNDQSPLASGGANTIHVGAAAPVTKDAPVVAKNEPVAVREQAPVKQPATAPAKEQPVSNTTATPPANTAPKEVLKEQPMPTETETSKPEVVNPTGAPANHKGGFFKKQYAESGKTTTGNAGIFKSTSGWGDGKYYALMNNVPIGTIVKISFSSTNKSVYAKVLGSLPEMKESTGLAVRLSDAAASELGVEISKFYVDVKY